MIRRLAAFAFAAAMLASAPARAEEKTFDLGFLKLGMPLEDLRSADWPPGSKLLCGTDEALPKLDAEAGKPLKINPRLQGSGIAPCGLFGRDDNGTWSARPITLGGNRATFWAMAITGDDGAPFRLAEVRMWQPKENFETTVAFLTNRFGKPDAANSHFARWATETRELSVAHDSTTGIITFLIDKPLYKVVTSRINGPSKGAKQ